MLVPVVLLPGHNSGVTNRHENSPPFRGFPLFGGQNMSSPSSM